MAERFTRQRCQDCQGGLIYMKKEKYWECPYCGKIYERELRFDKVQIDGLAGINDLVRSTLSKLIALDFAGAERELLECEKIDHAGVGTLIASVAVPLFKSFFAKDRQPELAKANSLLQKLTRQFPDVDEPEEILYDFIDSSDIYALLYVVYSMTNQAERKAAVFALLDCDEVYNVNMVKYLLSTLLKEGQMEPADVLIDKIQRANCRFGLSTVLTNYPDNEKKALHIDKLLSKADEEMDFSRIFDTYFASSKDDVKVVVDIFLSAVSHEVNFNTMEVINFVLQNCDSIENANHIFDALESQHLDAETSKAILDWCIFVCEDCDIAKIGFNSLYAGNSVFEITDKDAIRLLQTEQEEDVKRRKITQMLDVFKISGKNMDKLLAFHLNDNMGSFEYRQALFDDFASRVFSIPLNVIETYVLNVSEDEENKPVILRQAFEKTKNLSLGSGVISQYMKSTIDSPDIREEVIYTLLSLKLVPEPEAASFYLLNRNEMRSERVLDLMISLSCKTTSNTFENYLRSIDDFSTFNPKIAKIATQYSYALTAQSFVKYLLNAKEAESLKIGTVQSYYQTCALDVKKMTFRTTVGGVEIIGNIAQIYLFEGKDDLFVMQEIISAFQKDKIKIAAPIEIASSRKKVKLRKFIDSNASHLDKKIETLVQQLL